MRPPECRPSADAHQGSRHPPIRTEFGSKPIEGLKDYYTHGDTCDWVLARDELNDDARVRLRRFVAEAELLELRVQGRTIGTTAEHPFFVRGKGWTKAQDLRPGDELRLEAPGWLPV